MKGRAMVDAAHVLTGMRQLERRYEETKDALQLSVKSERLLMEKLDEVRSSLEIAVLTLQEYASEDSWCKGRTDLAKTTLSIIGTGDEGR